MNAACTFKKFVEEHENSCLDWPAQSLNLNPIQNVWHCIKQPLLNENSKS